MAFSMDEPSLPLSHTAGFACALANRPKSDSKMRNVRGMCDPHLTRTRLQLAIYFWLHRGECAGKHCKLASAFGTLLKSPTCWCVRSYRQRHRTCRGEQATSPKHAEMLCLTTPTTFRHCSAQSYARYETPGGPWNCAIQYTISRARFNLFRVVLVAAMFVS